MFPRIAARVADVGAGSLLTFTVLFTQDNTALPAVLSLVGALAFLKIGEKK